MLNTLSGMFCSAAPAVAPQVRNEKEILTRHRCAGQRKFELNFDLVDAGEIVVVDPVRGEHDGFSYIGGASNHKATRRDLTKAARKAAFKTAIEAHCAQRVLEISEKGEEELAKAKVAETPPQPSSRSGFFSVCGGVFSMFFLGKKENDH